MCGNKSNERLEFELGLENSCSEPLIIHTSIHTGIVESQLQSRYDRFHDYVVDFLVAIDISSDSLVQRVNYTLSYMFWKLYCHLLHC